MNSPDATPKKPKPYSLRADTEEPNLSWRLTKHGAEIAYFRMRVGGRDKWEHLGEIAPKTARAIIREKRRTLGEHELMRRLGAVDVVRDLSTNAELIAAYNAYFAGTTNEPRTGRNNVNCYLMVLRRGADVGETASVGNWNPDTIRQYEAETIRQVRAVFAADAALGKVWSKEDQEKKLASTLRTIAGTLRQARSLFAEDALKSIHYRELVLPPNLKESMKLDAGDRKLPGYKRPAASVVAAVVKGIEELRVQRPAMWLAAMLELVTGARRGSMVHARWSWFVDRGAIDFETERRQVTFEIRVAKGGEPDVPVYLEDYELLKSARPADAKDDDYIIPGKDAKERMAVLEGLVPVLRGFGLDRRQPNHELRKLFADSKRKAHGAEETTAALGQSDAKLLKYYTESGARRAVSLLDVLDPHRTAKQKLALERDLREQLKAGAKPAVSN